MILNVLNKYLFAIIYLIQLSVISMDSDLLSEKINSWKFFFVVLYTVIPRQTKKIQIKRFPIRLEF